MSITKKHSKRRDAKAINRPFSPDILARAREIAGAYQVVMWHEDGEYFGRGVELPGAMGDGKTPDDCMADIREAFIAVVATMLEDGQVPPAAARESSARSEQINIRLTKEEKIQLETSAQQAGFRGVSEYVRGITLSNGTVLQFRSEKRRLPRMDGTMD